MRSRTVRRLTRAASCLTVAGACTLGLVVGPPLASAAPQPHSDSASNTSPQGAPPSGPTLTDSHNIPTNAVSGNVTFLDNVHGVSGYSGLNFLHYDKYGYDFMFANGTGGLAVWSLKDPEHPALVGSVPAADLEVPGDTQARFWEGENMTVDPVRKLVFMSRDPRGFGGTLTTGQSGFYIIDVKDPWHPKPVIFHAVPAGHTSTCIDDCKYLWTVGPYGTGTPGNDPTWSPQPPYALKQGGVPMWVTDIHDINHPFTYKEPLDLNRFDGKTSYVHSVDVDSEGVAWVAGEGGDRGYWTSGRHWDPTTNQYRVATAYNPVPYAGGVSTPTPGASDDFFGYFDHNAQRVTWKLGNYPAGSLLLITNENIVTCSQAGELKIESLAGSFGGEGWRSTPENPFRLKLIGHYTAWGQEGSDTSAASCSAHWFTVNGNIVAEGWYQQGTRFIDISDPEHPKQVGYFRIPSGTSGVTPGSASAPYWHNGLVYVADYSRGVDVLKFNGTITGTQRSKICWNSCSN